MERKLNKNITTIIYTYIERYYRELMHKELLKRVFCVEYTSTYDIMGGMFERFPGFCANCKKYDFMVCLTEKIHTCSPCLYAYPLLSEKFGIRLY